MKKTNKGFSLVELIIVIAIMAILAGAIAPALIRYIDKSRKSNDVSSSKTIKTAVETAMSNEDTYELVTTATETSLTDIDGNTVKAAGIITVTPNTATNGSGNGIAIAHSGDTCDASKRTQIENDAKTEIGKNIGEKTPKMKYKKKADDTHQATNFYVFCSAGGTVAVGVGSAATTGNFYQLAPDVSKWYQ